MTLLPQSLRSPISSALTGWFASRAPKSDYAKLNLRNVYIFFSREGMLFAVLLLITFIAGVNYGNNLVLGLCFYLISIWLISFHVTFAHVSGLQVQLLEITTAQVGDPIWVTLQLRSDSRQPRRQLLFSFESPDKKTKQNKPVLIPRLQGEQTIRLPVMTTQRGEFELPRLKIKTVYPLGIMQAWSYVYFARSGWVYPKLQAFDWQSHKVATSLDDVPIGGHYVQSTQGQDDFERLDNYIEGESLARVSWGHVARGQGMFTKHFADPVGCEQTLDYYAMPAPTHEQKLGQLAYGVTVLGASGTPFQMRLPNDTAPPTIGHGDSFANQCLLALAKAP